MEDPAAVAVGDGIERFKRDFGSESLHFEKNFFDSMSEFPEAICFDIINGRLDREGCSEVGLPEQLKGERREMMEHRPNQPQRRSRRGCLMGQRFLVLIISGLLVMLLSPSAPAEVRVHFSPRGTTAKALIGDFPEAKSDVTASPHSLAHASSAEGEAKTREEGLKAPMVTEGGRERGEAIFLFKKILSRFFFPVALCLEILLVGLILLLLTRRQRAGKVILSVGFALLTLLSYTSIADMLLGPLESKYPPLRDPKAPGLLDPDAPRPVKWVVVLGGEHTFDPRLPVTSRVSSESLARLIEGIRIHRELSGTKLLLSGGGAFNHVSEAQGMAEVAIALGFDKRDLMLETASRDTKDQARLVKRIVGRDGFILVTSASHMPRSMALFRKRGMDPIAAPSDHRVKKRRSRHPGDFFPGASALRKSEQAFYEYLGLTWAKLRGQIP